MKTQSNEIDILLTEFIQELCRPIPEDGPEAHFVTNFTISPEESPYMIITIPQNSAERLLFLSSRMKEIEELAKNNMVTLPNISMDLSHFHIWVGIPCGDLEPLYELENGSIVFSDLPDFTNDMEMESIDIEQVAIDGDGAKIEMIYGSARWAYRMKPDMLEKLAQSPSAAVKEGAPIRPI